MHATEPLNDSYCAFFNASKHKQFDFLSNFYAAPIESHYGTFTCAEGLYQYQKFMHLKKQDIYTTFSNATGQEAWDLSRTYAKYTDPNWNRLEAMRETLRHKFSNQHLRTKLLATGSSYLVENAPQGHDSFWSDNGNGSGDNMLGILLMELRKELGGIGIVPVPDILKKFYTAKCTLCDHACFFTNDRVVYNYCDRHMGGDLTLGTITTRIPLSNIPDGTGRFLYFSLNDMPEFIEEGARLIAERIRALNLKNPFFVTPETSTIALAHVLRTKYHIDGIIVSKHKKPNDVDTISQEYCAVTSKEKKTLFLDKSIDLSGKDIVIIDNVCTTGETIKAVYQLLEKVGVDYKKIIAAIVLFTEGKEISEVAISKDIKIKVHTFAHIPILPSDPSIDNTLYHLYSSCDLPTHYGTIKFCVFKHRSLEKEAIACISPLTFHDGRRTNIPVRIHDACITSETFHSIKCDCQLQLHKALKYISEYGGIVIYLNQEGRGIGLGNKISAYNLQETLKLDTVQANRELGLPDDLREYTAARDILNYLGVESIMLMTNNTRKVTCLQELGINVAGTIPCIIKPESWQMKKYMTDKANKMGHMIPPDKLETPQAQSIVVAE